MHLPRISFCSAPDSMMAHTCMADTGVVYFYADFVRFRCLDFNVLDGEVFACFPSYGSLKSVSCHSAMAPMKI